MLPRKLSTDLTSLVEDQHACDRDRMEVAADGTVTESDVYRAVVLNRGEARLQQRSPHGSRHGASAPAPRGRAGARPAAPHAGPGRPGDEGSSAPARRLRLDTLEARAIFDGEVLARSAVRRGESAKERSRISMIAANGGRRSISSGGGIRLCGGSCRAPERWERIVELAAGLGGACPHAGRTRSSKISSTGAARRIPQVP